MTTPNTPDHNRDRDQAPPTVAEIAELTRRLRDLSARGRDADPGERAVFLADKDALIARITDTGTDAGSAGPVRHTHAAIRNRVTGDPDVGWSARATGADGSMATFDASGYYSDAHLSAIAAARDAGEHERAEALQNAPWTAQDTTTDHPIAETYAEVSAGADPWPDLVMPEWMAEQARRTEAQMAAGTYVAGPDDRAAISARIAALRAEHIAEAAAVDGDGESARTQCGPAPAVEEAEVRREQLTRWHHDDHPAGIDGKATDVGVETAQNGTEHPDGRADGCDDGSGWDR